MRENITISLMKREVGLPHGLICSTKCRNIACGCCREIFFVHATDCYWLLSGRVDKFHGCQITNLTTYETKKIYCEYCRDRFIWRR
jgi:hypothetical protein